MHFPSLLVALGVCGVIAAPLESQQPLAGSARHVEDPYKPGFKNPYDKKIDSEGDDLQPLPYVSLFTLPWLGAFQTIPHRRSQTNTFNQLRC
jgi:hypothetical protein